MLGKYSTMSSISSLLHYHFLWNCWVVSEWVITVSLLVSLSFLSGFCCCLFLLVLFLGRILRQTQTCYAGKAGFELLILLGLSHEGWDYRHVLPYLVSYTMYLQREREEDESREGEIAIQGQRKQKKGRKKKKKVVVVDRFPSLISWQFMFLMTICELTSICGCLIKILKKCFPLDVNPIWRHGTGQRWKLASFAQGLLAL